MAKATLKINGEKEFIIEDDLVTIGRASDNKISFPEDSNVSRYHAEIEERDGEFRLVELGSSNGTTVNGAPVDALSLITHRSEAASQGRQLVEKLRSLIPRQMFDVPIQAAIGARIIARESVKALFNGQNFGQFGNTPPNWQ